MSFEDWASREFEEIALDLKLRRPTPNQSIFKYISLNTKTSWSHLTRTLDSFELTGSTFNALNDPFELSPYIFDDLRPATIAKALGAGKSLIDTLNGKTWDPADEFGDVELYRDQAHKAFSRIQNNARIISFCERSDSPLLWSHYANSYQGACLHFLGGAFNRRDNNFGSVTYSSHRPTYPLSLALRLEASSRPASRIDPLARAESNKITFFTKAADWSYEREARIVYDSTKQNAVKFSSDGLLSIIVGPRIPKESLDRIKESISRSKIPHLPVRQAQLSNNSFSVEID